MPHALKNIDWQLFGAIGILISAGMLSLLSSSPDFFSKQVVWIVMSAAAAGMLLFVDLRSFLASRWYVGGLYMLTIGLLVITLLFAPQIKGNRAWLALGPFQFQPSEFAKVVLVIVLAHYFSKRHVGIARWKTIGGSFAYAALPAALVAVQPDLGSALILGIIWFGFVLASGIPLRRLAVAAIVFGIAFVLMWSYVLRDYQKARVRALFEPEQDPLGVNYSVIQSKIAIGSGGWFGKGFRQGTQVQLGFLPEAHNDFIFAAIAEEGGLIAVTLITGTFLWMFARILTMGVRASGNFFKFASLGAVAFFLGQFVLHVGSNVGFLPVVGTTLPFISYGGSSIMAGMIMVGILQSVYARE